jgi:KDO2-lipid IV(A) lauroyltransferase
MISDSLYHAGQLISRKLPLNKAYSFAEKVALLRYHFAFRGRKIVTDNLRTVLQSKMETFDLEKLGQLTKEVYKNFAKYLVEFLRYKNIDKEFIKQKINIVGLENLENCLKKGRGVISLSAHLGNWELGAAVVTALGYELEVVRLKHKTKAVNSFFDRKRVEKGIKNINTGVGVKRCYRVLKNNHILATVGDKNFSYKGEKARFFGKIAELPRGAAFFSYRMNSPIVPTFCIRRPDNNFNFHFGEPIEPDIKQDEKKEVSRLMNKGIEIIEDYVGRYKTQWLMFHRIWDT